MRRERGVRDLRHSEHANNVAGTCAGSFCIRDRILRTPAPAVCAPDEWELNQSTKFQTASSAEDVAVFDDVIMAFGLQRLQP